jgi:hypothetical protein
MRVAPHVRHRFELGKYSRLDPRRAGAGLRGCRRIAGGG